MGRIKRATDQQTLDLFEIPTAVEPTPASMDYRAEVSHLVGEMLRAAEGDRYEVAARASRLAGKEVSKYMLDAYASESREEYNLPFYLVPAIETACSSYALTNWLAGVRGGRVLMGRDVLAAELGKFESQRALLTEQIQKLKQLMGEVK